MLPVTAVKAKEPDTLLAVKFKPPVAVNTTSLASIVTAPANRLGTFGKTMLPVPALKRLVPATAKVAPGEVLCTMLPPWV